jgi:spermidine synthase
VQNPDIIDNWFIDEDSKHRWIYHRVKSHILSKKTMFQQVEFIDTYDFGCIVILDGKIQSSEVDEFIYHEALVHPAMITHPDPKNVLILGGGEGATLREVLKHPTVKRVVMVDIDEDFVHLCKIYLKKWHQGSFSDERVKLIFTDAREYIKNPNFLFDIIISDISDPVEKGPAQKLFTKDFYSSIKNILKPDGIFVTHATAVFYTPDKSISTRIFRMLSDIFPVADFYCEYIPSYSSLWAFTVGSLKYSPRKLSSSVLNRRLTKRGLNNLFYYDQETHERIFSLPKCVRKVLGTANL